MCKTCAYDILVKGAAPKKYSWSSGGKVRYEIKCAANGDTAVRCSGSNNDNGGRPSYSAKCSSSCMPKDPMVGWYKGVDGRVRQSCAEVCEAAGKKCDNTPTKDVDSEAKFKAINAAIAKNHGAGFACKLYQGNSHGHMPGMYWNQKWCQYRNDGKVSAGCSAAHPNDQRMCCCVGAGETAASVCSTSPPAPEKVDPKPVCLRYPYQNGVWTQFFRQGCDKWASNPSTATCQASCNSQHSTCSACRAACRYGCTFMACDSSWATDRGCDNANPTWKPANGIWDAPLVASEEETALIQSQNFQLPSPKEDTEAVEMFVMEDAGNNGYSSPLYSGDCCKHNAPWDDQFTLMCKTCAYDILVKGAAPKKYSWSSGGKVRYEIKCAANGDTAVRCSGSNNDNGGRPSYSAKCSSSCMPKDPMVGWYKGVDGRVRQSCAEVCEAAGKKCDNTPTKDVDSEAKFKAINAAIAKNHGAGFACKLYQGNSHGHMPGMYWNQKWCQYRNDGKVSAGCSAAHPNDQRMCCCVGAGETVASVCSTSPPAPKCYYEFANGCGGRCYQKRVRKCGDASNANPVFAFDKWHNRLQHNGGEVTCSKSGSPVLSLGEAKECLQQCSNANDFSITSNGEGMSGPSKGDC